MKNSYIIPALSLLSMPVVNASSTGNKVSDYRHSEKKNVILILTDDMRFDMLNYAGGKASTPNFDELRNSSTDFANACTVTGLSSPSQGGFIYWKISA
ncbi:sulfatase-like hydrolase/transferase [Bacteroides thetaiotaomicron]|nr:sulfatase-like hydrolase/transferase [Bacteroides thetaiotaomicron]